MVKGCDSGLTKKQKILNVRLLVREDSVIRGSVEPDFIFFPRHVGREQILSR